LVDLREHERLLQRTLAKLKGKAETDVLVAQSGMTEASVMRAAAELKEKGLVEIHEQKETVLKLSSEGKLHADNGLPERRLTNALERLGGRAKTDKIYEEAGLEKQFIPIGLGWAQKKKWTSLDGKTGTLQLNGKPDAGDDEKLLCFLNEKGTVTADELPSEMHEASEILRKRKLLNIEEKTDRVIELTSSGKEALSKASGVTREVTQLTQELIASGKWRKLKLQEYNIEAPVAPTWAGKKHPYLMFLDQVRNRLVELGFKEMDGTAVETSFFNFDALFTPQDHPAREASGIYSIKSPKEGCLSVPKNILAKVKETHENGWKTGSCGWKYQFSTKETKRLVLRSHGTCLSARKMLSRDLQVPGRYFSIARCYRPEIVDKTHLTEFNQVEGIVIDRDLTLRDLLGVLEKFALEIAGADEVKFKPDYFPFTEPSVELSAYKEGYGWIEFGGSGIFRPEVTEPLGVKEPVIAWGLGIDRLFMMRAGIEEIRYIFSQNLDWIRRKAVM
jgi:phenylalanyl-tRNA synthetase alpha chain